MSDAAAAASVGPSRGLSAQELRRVLLELLREHAREWNAAAGEEEDQEKVNSDNDGLNICHYWEVFDRSKGVDQAVVMAVRNGSTNARRMCFVAKSPKNEMDKVEKEIFACQAMASVGGCAPTVLYHDDWIVVETGEGDGMDVKEARMKWLSQVTDRSAVQDMVGKTNATMWKPLFLGIGQAMKKMHTVLLQGYSDHPVMDGAETTTGEQFEVHPTLASYLLGGQDSGAVVDVMETAYDSALGKINEWTAEFHARVKARLVQGVQVLIKREAEKERDMRPVLLHYDIGGDNLMVSIHSSSTTSMPSLALAALVDFGDAGSGDPLSNFAILYTDYFASRPWDWLDEGYGSDGGGSTTKNSSDPPEYFDQSHLWDIGTHALLRLSWALKSSGPQRAEQLDFVRYLLSLPPPPP
mmetsp:Transcript_12145/g.22927  ORF Transcript_12145/g.22927 Transcript_12145/m.22927 type:complete len:411 (-) Transcript_12145:801-2033(-)|eukprot:CAMPEP_0197466384 /NCGR_PEP_ID=MMETSP1175-20131217/65023_1 /TAXON_ID=1003142 /ORGANISM="Triceratium dubium, Strain CCMP147" /LENGTH=410 /DNA_ID=CAMNT_0043002419 /DNA_START=134 /DNA_END=1366 /DNA_ORIENTATION=-